MHYFDNEVDTENREIIIDLITKHWGFDFHSDERFKKELNDPFVDPLFSNLLDNDLRYRIPYTVEMADQSDLSWKEFKQFFPSFQASELAATAEEYFRGKRDFSNGVSCKLSKTLCTFYLENQECFEADFRRLNLSLWINGKPENGEIRNTVRSYYRNVTTTKFFDPDYEWELVMSFNFADWLLASTVNSWTTCLNLNSTYEEMYWAGLPNLAVDRNRVMFYITKKGARKEYRGIEVDKTYSRVWGLLLDNHSVMLGREYPYDTINSAIFNARYSFSCTDTRNGKGKYPLYPLTFEKDDSAPCIYQDFTRFEKINGEIYECGCVDPGSAYIQNWDIKDDIHFNFDAYEFVNRRGLIFTGLDALIEAKRLVSDFSIATAKPEIKESQPVEIVNYLNTSTTAYGFIDASAYAANANVIDNSVGEALATALRRAANSLLQQNNNLGLTDAAQS